MAMEKEIQHSVRYAKSPRAYELKQTLRLTRQEGMSVSSYYTKLIGIWEEIQSVFPVPKCSYGGCSCDLQKELVAMKEKDRLYEFLMGLDEGFAVIRTQILCMTPTPTLGAANHLVSEDERHRQIAENRRPNAEVAAFQTHQMEERRGGERPKCTFCHRLGHIKENCYGLVGYPPNRKGGPRNFGQRGDQQRDQRYAPKAACVEGDASPIPGVSAEQFERMLQYFGGGSEQKNEAHTQTDALANISGLSLEKSDRNG